MSPLLVIGLIVLGWAIVYVTVPHLPISHRILSTTQLLRIVGCMAVVLLVGMAWTQRAAIDAHDAADRGTRALSRAEDSAYKTCQQRNDTIQVNLDLADARIFEARRDVVEDEDDLAEVQANPPVGVDDIPVIQEIRDPAVQDLLGILADQNAADYDKEVAALEEHLTETQSDIQREIDAKTAYADAAPRQDCDRLWAAAAARARLTANHGGD